MRRETGDGGQSLNHAVQYCTLCGNCVHVHCRPDSKIEPVELIAESRFCARSTPRCYPVFVPLTLAVPRLLSGYNLLGNADKTKDFQTLAYAAVQADV